MVNRTSVWVRIICVLLCINLLALPIFAQQAESSSSITAERIATLKAEAQADAKAMDKAGGYFFGGFLCGIFGYLIAIGSEPQVPAEKLIELSDAEKVIYSEAYKAEAKKKRGSTACSGWLLGSLIGLLLLNAGGAQ